MGWGWGLWNIVEWNVEERGGGLDGFVGFAERFGGVGRFERRLGRFLEGVFAGDRARGFGGVGFGGVTGEGLFGIGIAVFFERMGGGGGEAEAGEEGGVGVGCGVRESFQRGHSIDYYLIL